MSGIAPNQRPNLAPESFTNFGDFLLFLRRRARLRQRDLAVAVGYSEAHIGRLENGQRLPDVATVMAQFVEALDLEDEPDLATRLIELARAAREGHEPVEQELDVSLPAEVQHLPADSRSPAPEPSTNLYLAQQPTPFLGRTAELARLAVALRDSKQRCVTLTGPGGVGKTRLAFQTAASLASSFGAGAHVVALAAVPSANLLIPAIAEALGLATTHDADLPRRLRAYLHDKHLLLVLDNLEHLIDSADLVADLLSNAERLYVLATSRERLQIRGEVVLEVSGLPVPDPAEVEAGTLADNGAVALFLATARRIRHGVAPAPENIATIARICRLVEGLPLAIELAASWSHVLSTSEIEKELERTLDFLQTRMRDLPARHRSMRGTLAHSWDLLGPAEQRVLRRLSVFRGAFTREAAEAALIMTLFEREEGLTRHSVLPLLSALVDKSMVKRVGTSSGSRYLLHDLVRQFAAEQLSADEEEEQAVRDGHSRYYLELVTTNENAIRSESQPQILQLLSGELENIRAALEYVVSAHDVRSLRRVLPALLVLFEWRYTVLEGLALFGSLSSKLQVVEVAAETANDLRAAQALALAYHGWFNFYLGHADEATHQLRSAQELAAQSGDALALGDALLFLGFIIGSTDDKAAGRRLLLASLRAYEVCGDGWRIARALYRLGMLLDQDGEYIGAQHLFSVCWTRLKAIGDPRATALTLNRLGVIHAQLGRYTEAETCLQQSLLHCSSIHDRRGIASALFHLGSLAQHIGDLAVAQYFFRESMQLFLELQERFSVADALAQIGYTAIAENGLDEARRTFDEAWQGVRDAGVTPTSLSILAGIAALDLAAGQIERAVEELTIMLFHPISGQETRDRAARLLRRAEEQLTPYQFVTAQARGRTASQAAYLA